MSSALYAAEVSEIIIRTWTDLPRTRIAKSAMPKLDVIFSGEPVLHGVIEPAQDNDRGFAPSRVSVWGRYPVSLDQLDSLTYVAENPGPFAFTRYTEAVQELVFGTADHQRRLLARLIELVRWRTGHPWWSSDHTSGKDSHEEWSLDGSIWHILEVTATLTWEVREHGPALNQTLQDSLDELARAGEVEPLGWEILHSALTARERGDSRSVIILAVSAVEIELKRLIGQLVPDADWLMVNIQAPDVHKMSKSYLPSLPGIPQAALPPKRLLTSLQKAIELRNKTCPRRRAAGYYPRGDGGGSGELQR